MKMDIARQATIDFERGEQLGFLRDALIPNGSVRSMTAKTVLGAIDEFCRGNGECFASQETLSKVSNCSRRTVQRAIDQLLSLGILNVHRRSHGIYGGIANTYTINWLIVKSFSTAACVDKIIDHSDSEFRSTNASLSPTNASLSPTNASLSPTNASLRRTRRIETSIQPTTTADAKVVVEILMSSGLHKRSAIELATKYPVTVEQADQIVRTFNQNSHVLKHPRSICYFLENGNWPAKGVIAAPSRDQLEQRARVIEQNRSRQLIQERQAIQQQEAEKQLEERLGSQFDALPVDQQDEIARTVLDAFSFARWKKGNRSLFRAQVLKFMEQEVSR